MQAQVAAPLEMPPAIVAEAMAPRALSDMEDIEALAGISSLVKASMDNVQNSFEGERHRVPASRLDVKTLIREEARKIRENSGIPQPPQSVYTNNTVTQIKSNPPTPVVVQPQLEFQFDTISTQNTINTSVNTLDRIEVRLKGIENSLNRIGDLLIQLIESYKT